MTIVNVKSLLNYMPSCLTCLRALRALITPLARLIWYLRALLTRDIKSLIKDDFKYIYIYIYIYMMDIYIYIHIYMMDIYIYIILYIHIHTFFFDYFFYWAFSLISHWAFSLCTIFKPNWNELIIMIMMINITIIETYPLK